MLAGSVGEPGDVGEDDDRRRLAGGELGLERDVRVAALDAGRVDLRAGTPCWRRRNGVPARSRKASVGTRTTNGRRMTPCATRSQRDVGRAPRSRPTGGSGARRPPSDSELTRWPSIPSTAGRNVSAKTTEHSDDERARDADRADRRGREQEQPGQADRDRDPGERDGLARRRDRPLDGLTDGPAAPQLLPEPADDEQRVVDREGQAEHRRDVEHEDAHLDLLGDEIDERQARGIARPATSSGMPAAMTDAKTRTRMSAAIGSDTVSARWRSFSDCTAESWVIGP